MVCLAISDVVGDDLSVIGSGPTVPDPSTYSEAWGYIERIGVESLVTEAVKDYLRAGLDGRIDETPKPGDARFARSITRVIGGRFEAMSGAAAAARSLGYDVITSDEPVIGDARTMGPQVLERARSLASGRTRPLAVVASGETTVKVIGTGKGGRNQEMALAVARSLEAEPEDVAFASFGTDGVDGPTDAAGAHVDATTLSRARQQSIDADAFLADNNSYAFFQRLGDLIMTGPSTTNVGDIHVTLFGSRFRVQLQFEPTNRYIPRMLSKEQILNLIREKVTHPATPRELIKSLRIPQDERATFRRLLKTLVTTGELVQTKGGRVGLPEKMDLVSGRLEMHAAGYGFVVPDRRPATRPTCTCLL